MIKNAVIPMNSPHTYISVFRPPHGKEYIPPDKNQSQSDDIESDLKFDVDILFDTFLEGYNDLLTGKMTKGEEFYKLYGIPGPSQYKAFNEFYNLFNEGEFEFLNKRIFYFYDISMMNDLSKIGMLEFIENMTKFDFVSAGQEKKVVFASGSFWGKRPDIRERVISHFYALYKNGIEIEVYTQAQEDEVHMDKLCDFCSKNSRFGLTERIPIHYIGCGSDYFFIEFPHTEDIVVRLNMFLDLNDVCIKQGITKADVVQFFDNLIKKAVKENAR